MNKISLSINLELPNDDSSIEALTDFIKALRGTVSEAKVETREAPAPVVQTALAPGEDLPAAEPARVAEEVEEVIGIPCMDAPRVSAKTGENVEMSRL